jgi:hypothetical protein
LYYFSTLFFSFSFFPYINNQPFISLITSTIDIFVAIIIAVSVFQATVPIINTIIKSILISLIQSRQQKNKKEILQGQATREEIIPQKQNMIKKNFIRGLLLALELESANAILKMGIFTSLIIQSSSSISLLSSSSLSNFNNFIFFVAVLSLRIAINQTLRRFNVR